MWNKLLVASALAIVFGFVAPADAAPSVKMGVLTCNVASGWSFVFGSSKDIRCTYAPIKGSAEYYNGSIKKFGADIGYTRGGVMVWGVFAPASGLKRGGLSGEYVGATASATAVVGAGANVLIGGFERSVTLQPVSIEGNTGLNLAAGIGALHLVFAY